MKIGFPPKLRRFLPQRSLKTLGFRVLPGLIAGLLVTTLLLVGVWQPLENLAYVWLFQLRGEQPWSDRVVVVEIDEASLDQIGHFPWSRQYYTDLLEVLTPAEPSAVVLDILLPESSPDDAALANAMMKQGRVVLAQSWSPTGNPLLPTSVLQQAAIGTGHVYKVEDVDGLVRSILPQQQGIVALGVMAAQVYSLVEHPVQLPLMEMPVWINWSGSTQNIEHYSFVEVLAGSIPDTAFRHKVVLIGVRATGLDSLPTPFNLNPPASGVYLQAALVSNLLQNKPLHKIDGEWLPVLLLLIAPLLSLGLSACRYEKHWMAWVSLSLGWGLVSLLAFRAGFWIPTATPIALISFTSASVTLREQRQITHLLRQSEERYALAVRGSNEGLWDWNLMTNDVYYSPRWKEMLGYDDTEVGNRPHAWFKRVHPDDLQTLQDAINKHREALTPHFEGEYRILHQDGTYRWMLCRGVAVRDRDGNAYRMTGSQTDITDRKQAEEKLRLNAFYDELTGLPNRALFLERLKEAIALVQQYPTFTFAVLWLDLDGFKVVNNSLGSELGDRLLISTAQRLKAFLPPEDVVARMGGDEFTILLNRVRDANDATLMAERLQQVLALPFRLDGHEVYATVSIGIALSSILYRQPEHLLRDADTAMHRAKALGRARAQVFDNAMRIRMLERLQLENDLRRAITNSSAPGDVPMILSEPKANLMVEEIPIIDRRELQLYYQPIVQLTTGQVAGFEALVRWRHPKQGLISPGRFVPMAEETGLIIPLGWWVLREACHQMREWHHHFRTPLTISVNLSSKQFSLSGLTEHIRQILLETDLEAACLKLEITESTVMENASSVVALLRQIQALGIQLAIDDFGTGYSSLSYLPRFPVNTLKIDRSFTSKIGINQDSLEIVRTILALAHNLGMDVTAEGVETQDQAEQLLTMQCEYGQGYLFSKPLDSDAAFQLLAQQFKHSI